MANVTIERATAIAAAVAAPLGLAVGGVLVPSAVDHVTPDDAYGRLKVVVTSHHLAGVRIGFLGIIVTLLCLAPATRRVLLFAPERGAVLTGIGWRLVAIGGAAGAVGNAFAPLIVPSTVGFDPDVMGAFIHHHETSSTSYAIIAVYALLAPGALVLFLGLLRAGQAPWPASALLALSLGAVLVLHLGPQAIADAIALGVAFAYFQLREPPPPS